MCDIISGMMMASTVMSAVGSVSAGNAAAAASKSDAAVARMNANLINYRIDDELRIGGDELRRRGEEAAGVIGGQTVYGAAGNLDMTMGSPLRALLASADAASRDAGTSYDNTMRGVRDLRTEQSNYRNSAKSLNARAKQQRAAGRFEALGAIIGGGSGIIQSRSSRGVQDTFNMGRARITI